MILNRIFINIFNQIINIIKINKIYIFDKFIIIYRINYIILININYIKMRDNLLYYVRIKLTHRNIILYSQPTIFNTIKYSCRITS